MLAALNRPMSPRAAGILFFAGWAAIVATPKIGRFFFNFPRGSLGAQIASGVEMAVLFFILGAIAAAGLAMNRKTQLTWRGLILFSLDVALMPVIVLPLMFLCLMIAQAPITLIVAPWLGEQFGGVLGFELFGFVLVIAVPFLPHAWPIFYQRMRRSQSSIGYCFAPKTWIVVCGFVLFSLAILLVSPPITLWLSACASWLCLAAVYHWLLLPRFPRWNETADQHSGEAPHAG